MTSTEARLGSGRSGRKPGPSSMDRWEAIQLRNSANRLEGKRWAISRTVLWPGIKYEDAEISGTMDQIRTNVIGYSHSPSDTVPNKSLHKLSRYLRKLRHILDIRPTVATNPAGSRNLSRTG